MTLTTLSRKELKPLYKWALNRNKGIIIIYSIVLFVLGPIIDMYIISVQHESGSELEEIGMISLVIFQAIAALFTFISALKTFSFLHNKRSVDMFGALPANRTTMYVSHLLAGLTAITSPYIVMTILTMGLTARSGDMIKFGLYTILTTVLMITAAYISTSLVAYCCGTVIDTAIVSFGANVIWVGIIGLYYGFITEMIPGMEIEAIIDTPMLTLFAPYGFSAMATGYYMAEQIGSCITLLIWMLIFIAGSLFLALLAANKRKAETSQNGFAVKWLPMAIEAGASVVCGGLIGFIAAETANSGYSNMFVFCFWYAIIGFVAFAVLHLIFARGLKGKLLPAVITFAATTAAAIAILFGFSFGFGIDTYVPNPATVKSVTFGSYDAEYKDPENIKTITEIHKIITDGVRKNNEYPYYLGDDTNRYRYYDDVYTIDEEYSNSYKSESYTLTDKQKNYLNSTSFWFRYKKTIGFGVSRYYYIDSYSHRDNQYNYYEIVELLKKLYSSEEYKRIRNEKLFDDEAEEKIQSGALTYYFYFGNEYVQSGTAVLPDNKEFMSKFREALRQDIIEDKNYQPDKYFSVSNSGASDFIGESCIHASLTYLNDNKPYETDYYYNNDVAYNDNTFTVTTIIKPYYKNTLQVLRDYQVSPTASKDYQDYSFDYPSSYYNFCEDGRPDTLRMLAEDFATDFVLAACAQYEININEWLPGNFTSYKGNLLHKADELYTKYMVNNATLDQPSKQQDYDDNYPYQEQADQIINELMEYTFKYVEMSVNGTLPM